MRRCLQLITINPNSIKNGSKYFEPLVTSFSHSDYIISIEAKTFTYKENDNFNVNNLQELFQEDGNVRGKIKKTTLDEAMQTIKESISYYPYSYPSNNYFSQISKDKAFIYFREKALWMIIKEFFPSTPEKVYTHIPDTECFFDFGIMWLFCYIFLKNGKGLVLCAGAYD